MNAVKAHPVVTPELRALVEAIVEAAHPLRVILFGSCGGHGQISPFDQPGLGLVVWGELLIYNC